MSQRRIVCLVADGFGVGEAPDAAKYGDTGSNTLGNLAKHLGGISLPNLETLGIGTLGNFTGIAKNQNPKALCTRLAEKSAGKDTTTGHWELAGLVTRKPFPVYPNGFPETLLQQWVNECGLPGYLGNYAASGTAIIEDLGEEHLQTGKPIVYTSADSVFQIAVHEEKFGIEALYHMCRVARKLTLPLQIGRVIARPFVGTQKDNFRRTEKRRDFSLAPGRNVLDTLYESNIDVLSVGKIDDIFDHRSITKGNHTGNNRESFKATLSFLKDATEKPSFIFVNLVDFDMLYGHRRDPVGYAKALTELDHFLPELLSQLKNDDQLIITSDHGCDPTFKGSDHTREYVPLIAYSPNQKGQRLADRESFADLGASILHSFGVKAPELTDLGKVIFS